MEQDAPATPPVSDEARLGDVMNMVADRWEEEAPGANLVTLEQDPATPPTPGSEATPAAPAAAPKAAKPAAPAPETPVSAAPTAEPAAEPETTEPTAGDSPDAGRYETLVAETTQLKTALAALQARLDAGGGGGNPTPATPAGDPEPEPEPLADLSQLTAQLDGRMQECTNRYFQAQGQLQLPDGKPGPLLVERDQKARELNAIQEELRDPFDDTDGPALEGRAKRLQRDLGKLNEQIRRADATAAHYFTVMNEDLRPQKAQLATMAALHADLNARRRTEDEQRTRAENAASYTKERSGFYDSAKAVSADATLIPADLAEDFLGTEANNFEDGWIRSYALAYLTPKLDGSVPRIQDFPKFCKAGAKLFMERTKRAHQKLSGVYAKTKESQLPKAGPGRVAPPETPADDTPLEDRVRDLVDERWGAEEGRAAH